MLGFAVMCRLILGLINAELPITLRSEAMALLGGFIAGIIQIQQLPDVTSKEITQVVTFRKLGESFATIQTLSSDTVL